jgi:starvation-inducible DNA-binding protein
MKTEESNNPKIESTEQMKQILADQFILYVKARNYHWNVTGPHFYYLHALFENIYDELADDIDKVAERIRSLGTKTPGTMKEFWELTSLEEKPGNYPEFSVMVQEIANDFETIIEKLKSSANKMQSSLDDEVSAGMLYGLMEKYQKTVWMLKSFLEK